MKNYLGVLVIVLGALILFVSHLMEWVDNNWNLFLGLGLIVAGLIAHIYLTKKADKLD